MKRINYFMLMAGVLALISCRNDKDQPDAYGTFEADEASEILRGGGHAA
jgi:hypothetical protein